MSCESRTVEVNLINKEAESEENNHCFGLRLVCAFGVCTNVHYHDRRNNNNEQTNDHNGNNHEYNLRDGHCEYIYARQDDCR